MTRLENAGRKVFTAEMESVSEKEGCAGRGLLRDIRNGRAVILKNAAHDCVPVGIGRGLRVKVNANIGTSASRCDPQGEIEKLRAALRYGADTVMDLSTGGDTREIRRRLLGESRAPLGTVPVYDVMLGGKDVSLVRERDFLDAIETHVRDGVDFITVHCGIRKGFLPLLKSRVMGIVSRGGSFLAKWMLHHGKENPLFTRFEEILCMAREHDVTLSLGDGLRPGSLADATDRAQVEELKTLGFLARKAREKGVQVMIEGPGHVPLDQIRRNVRLEKKHCRGAPFYVLGPLVTDASPGYDHISGAIGGALAALHGADFLCFLTPAEHLGLPDIGHVIDGVVASRIAAHAADVARAVPGARDLDDAMSRARSDLDWEAMFAHAMNPERARSIREACGGAGKDACTMCGELCSAKLNREMRGGY